MASGKSTAVPSETPQYDIGESIGFGAFGVAYLGTQKGDPEREVVIKKIYDTAAKEEDVKALKELKHDRILEIRDSYVDEMGTLYLVMEKADKSSLTKLLSCNGTPTVELNVWRFVSHLSSGLAYLHSRNILHQDLNPDNVMAVRAWSEVAQDFRTDWKLTDFSLPTLLNQEVKERFYSHVRGAGQVYWAPEALNDPDFYGPPADIWALGAVVSAFCNQGKHLFTDMDQVLQWNQGHSLPIHYSEDLKQLQGNMLAIDSGSRPTAKEVSAECTSDRQAIHLDAQPLEDKQVPIATDSFTEAIPEVLPEFLAEKENDSQDREGHAVAKDVFNKSEMELENADDKENVIQNTDYPEDISKVESRISSGHNEINEDFTPIKKERKKKKKIETQSVGKSDEVESLVLSADIDNDKKKKKKKEKKNKESKEKKEKKEKKKKKVPDNSLNILATQGSNIHEKEELDKTDENKVSMDIVDISPIQLPNGAIIKIPNGTVSNLSDVPKSISSSRRNSIHEDTLSCATDTLTRRKKKRAPIPEIPTSKQAPIEPVKNEVATNPPEVVKRKKKKAPRPPEMQKIAEILTTSSPDIQISTEIQISPELEKQKPSEVPTTPQADMPQPTVIPTAAIEKIPLPTPRKKHTKDKFEETTEIHQDLGVTPMPKERKKKKNKNKTEGFSDYAEGNVMQESITSFASEGSIDSGVDVIETPPTSECSQEFPNHSDDILRSEVIINDVHNSTLDSIEDTNEEHTDDTLQHLTQDNGIETSSDPDNEAIELDDTIYESPIYAENFDTKNDNDLKSNSIESIIEDTTEVNLDEKLMISEEDETISTPKEEISGEFTDDENKDINSGKIYWTKSFKPLENIDDFSLDMASTKLDDEDSFNIEAQEVNLEFDEEIMDVTTPDHKSQMDHYYRGKVEKENDFDINSFVKGESHISQQENNQLNNYSSIDENTPRSLKNVIGESMNSGEYNAVQKNMTKKVMPKKTFAQFVTPVITLQTWEERGSKKVTVQNHQSESGIFWDELHKNEQNVSELNTFTKKPVERSASNVNVPIHSYKPIKTEKFVKQEEKKISVQNHQPDNDEFWQAIHKDRENELEINSFPQKTVNHLESSTKNVNVSIQTYKPMKSEISVKKEERKPFKVKVKAQKSSINKLAEAEDEQDTDTRVKGTDEEVNVMNVNHTGSVFSNILRDFDEKRIKKISEVRNIEKPILKPKPDIMQLTKNKDVSKEKEEFDITHKSKSTQVETKSLKENTIIKNGQDTNDYSQKRKTFYMDAFSNQPRKTSYSFSGNTLPKAPRKTSMAPFVTHNWRPIKPHHNGILENGQTNEIPDHEDRVKPYTSLSWRYSDKEKQNIAETSTQNSTSERAPDGEISIEKKNNRENARQNRIPEIKDIKNSSPTPAPRLSISETNQPRKENNAINNHLKVFNEPTPWDVFMESIQKGSKLKPVMTNDRSSPMLTRKLKKIQPVDIYDRDSQQVTQNKQSKNQSLPLSNQEPPKTLQDPFELSQKFNKASQRPLQPPEVPSPPPSLGSFQSLQNHPPSSSPLPPPPPPVGSLQSSQSNRIPSGSTPLPQDDNGDLLKAIQLGKKLKPVSNIEKKAPELDARSIFLTEIREGKKLKSVQCNDRSGPSLRTGKYS